MRLIGVAMVKNEADVIEAFVRHNLGMVDRLLVIDHASADNTLSILHSLRDEGLPLEVLRDPAAGFDQADRISAVVRDGLARHAADYAFALDADEFILAPNRKTLNAALAAQRADVYATPWSVYVPPVTSNDDPHPLRRVRLRASNTTGMHGKAVVGRAFIEQRNRYIAVGNHWVMEVAADRETERTIPPVPLTGVQLAHLPLRSPAQFLSKIVQGWLGYRLAYAHSAGKNAINWHWRRLFDDFLRGRQFDAADLQHYALRVYAQPADTPEHAALPELIDDPIPCAFELRYTQSSRIDPLRLLAAWANQLVDSLTPAPAAQNE
jgi:hypothetical protein